MNMKIRIGWGKIFILQVFLFLFTISSVTGGNESVLGDVNYNIELFGVKSVELQAPEVYINQSFWVRATIRVNQSYGADTFNATIILPAGFILPGNDQNHSNPDLAGFGSEWVTNWTVEGPPTESNYTINATILFFNSTKGDNITVNAEPANWENGSVIVDAGGPYNFSDTGTVYTTVKDRDGNYTNIIAECNTTLYYPDASMFEENKTLSYLAGSHGQYYYNFTVPNVTGNYTANANCTLPEASNTSTFEVVTTNRTPYFTNIFAITGSYIHRSDNNPIPTQDVDFWVYVTEPDGDSLTVIISYSTDGMQSFSNKTMVYDSQTGTWRAQIGNFVAQTTAYYYVIASDGSLTNRTPTTGYDSLVWDFPPSQPGGGGTGGIIRIPEPEVGKGKIEVVEYPVNISIERGGMEFTVVKIKNAGNDTLHNVFITLEGIDLSWYSIDPSKTDIEASKTKNFVIKFIVPLDATVKQYPVNIRVDSDETVERIQTIFEVTPGPSELLIRITDIEIPQLEPNKAVMIKVFIENQDTVDQNLFLALTVPSSWLIDEKEQTKIIPAKQQVVFEFNVMPTREDVFILKLSGSYADKELEEDIPVNVQVVEVIPVYWESLTVLIAIIVVIVIIAVLLARRRGANIYLDKRVKGGIKRAKKWKSSRDDRKFYEVRKTLIDLKGEIEAYKKHKRRKKVKPKKR